MLLDDVLVMRMDGRTSSSEQLTRALRKEFDFTINMNEPKKEPNYTTGGKERNTIYFDGSNDVYVTTDYDEIFNVLKENSTLKISSTDLS